MGVKGEVENHTDGVSIRAVFLSEEICGRFIERIRKEHPPVASIYTIHSVEGSHLPQYTTFSITPSRQGADEVTQVAPDIAVCPECLNERETQTHRLGYPFINCTGCGPRFTILRDLPYDREQITMSVFRMCPICREEYETETDRRFHAQPVACIHCGPAYYARYKGLVHTDYEALLTLSSHLLREGREIAAKGIGGYHLVCDALNEQAVSRLREIKVRDTKPFALMFSDLEALKAFAFVNEAEAACLSSWRRPIVLLKQRTALPRPVNPGMHTLGAMLPYMPLHYDWFRQLDTPALVMTSGNRNDAPIALSETEADEQFGGKVELILHHNRDIHNRVDDSVVHVCNGLPCLIRRSRGYVPEPFFTTERVEGILAFGAEQVNTFALGKGNTILQSQHIGDLKNWDTFRFYTESLARLQRLFRFSPRLLVCDLHPGYLSSCEAERLAKESGLPLLRVQHHYAHALACMTEYGLHRPVIAIVMDGTGLGDDGHLWGGEFLLCDRQSYQRLAHFEYIPMPGGDKASLEPWRMATACLHTWKLPFPEDFTNRIGDERISRIRQMADRKLYSPLTSGAGRLFDAVASLLGVCDVSTRQGEAPILLEQSIGDITASPYPFESGDSLVSLRPMMEAILQDMEHKVATSLIAARFHTTLAHLFVEKAQRLMAQTEAKEVVVSGGCFQNKYLLTLLQDLFAKRHIPLYIPSRIPCNDGGISVGQLMAGACHDS
jgi:hydrogenase maturation protein HypF